MANNNLIIGLVLTTGIILGIKMMSSPKTARKGNLLGSLSMLAAVIFTLVSNGIITEILLWSAIIIGSIIGSLLAKRVNMIQMPQLVALLNGFGGGASALVAAVILFSTYQDLNAVSKFVSLLALLVGGVTLSGSLIAAAKLDQRISQKAVIIKNHTYINYFVITLNSLLILNLTFNMMSVTAANISILLIIGLSLFFGITFAIRVGGADMPITISLLNSFSGLAASITGFALFNTLLVLVGAVVGASGLILTQIMCRAMNRSLLEVLSGNKKVDSNKKSKVNKLRFEAKTDISNTERAIKAEKILIVPGYGMALSQAQNQIKELYNKLIEKGKEVNFAIHPVAGRMPGHMNVLLAEVDIPYEKLLELELANPKFEKTDLVIVIGANDVINPAAKTAEGTPIYGMPVLEVEKAKEVLIFNLDKSPGYAGVNNPLYNSEKTELVLGDAKDNLNIFLAELSLDKKQAKVKKSHTSDQIIDKDIIIESEKIIVVPGYGMALAQAQSEVMSLVNKLKDLEKEVKIAIHPVAGRMPGHMNVLLAEAGVDYEQLYDLESINDQFKETDLTLVVGANDVINPAAKTASETPIYGMPVLEVVDSKKVIILNLDKKPGYAGVDNLLYEDDKVTILLGDAKKSLQEILAVLD